MQEVFSTIAHCGFEWIDITAPSEEELRELAAKYKLHSNLVQDCLEPEHLPKMEFSTDVGFIVARLYDDKSPKEADTIQLLTRKVAIFYSKEFIITIHRTDQPFLKDIRTSLHQDADAGNGATTSAVLFRILQYVLLSYEEPSLKLVDQLDFYEDKIFVDGKTHPSILKNLYYIRRKASIFKRINHLSRNIIDRLDEQKQRGPLFQEALDDFIHIETMTDQVLESVNNLMSVYLSLSSQKTNEVMRVLTIFSVFFMPLTFIVGIYGMNFKFMPELEWRYGYPIAGGVMFVITLGIFIWFRRRKWL